MKRKPLVLITRIQLAAAKDRELQMNWNAAVVVTKSSAAAPV
jgi:hypothetical protein